MQKKLKIQKTHARQANKTPQSLGTLLASIMPQKHKVDPVEPVRGSSRYYETESIAPDRSVFNVSRLISGIKSYQEIARSLSRLTKKHIAVFDTVVTLCIKFPHVYASQQYLADRAGACRKTANVALKRMQAMGLICKVYRHNRTCLYGINLGLLNMTTLHRLKNVLRSAHLLPMLVAKQVLRDQGIDCYNNRLDGVNNKITHNKRIKHIYYRLFKSGSNNVDLDGVAESVLAGESAGYSGCWLKDGYCVNAVHANSLAGDINPDIYKFMGGRDALCPKKLIGEDMMRRLRFSFGELPSYVYAIMSRFTFDALSFARNFVLNLFRDINKVQRISIEDGIRYFMGVAYKYSRENNLYIDSRLMLMSLACLPSGLLNAGQFGSKLAFKGMSNQEVYKSSSYLGRIEVLNRKKKQGLLSKNTEFPKKERLAEFGSSAYSSYANSGERPSLSPAEREKQQERLKQLEHLKMKETETIQDYIARSWDCPAYRYILANVIDRDAFYDAKDDHIMRSTVTFYVHDLIKLPIEANMEYAQPKKVQIFDHIGQYVYKAGESSEDYFNRIGDIKENEIFKMYMPIIKALIDSPRSEEDKTIQVNKNISSIIERIHI